MKVLQRSVLMLALAIPATTLLAAEMPAQDGHASHHSVAAPAATATAATTTAMPADLMPAMRDRMRQMRQIQDPEKRMDMMDAQMKDMEAMMQGPKSSCPKADAKGGMGMMGGKCGKGMMGGKGGMGMPDDMMGKRMEMMEKRMDMMQMMMQMRMQGMGGGMGMPAN